MRVCVCECGWPDTAWLTGNNSFISLREACCVCMNMCVLQGVGEINQVTYIRHFETFSVCLLERDQLLD